MGSPVSRAGPWHDWPPGSASCKGCWPAGGLGQFPGQLAAGLGGVGGGVFPWLVLVCWWVGSGPRTAGSGLAGGYCLVPGSLPARPGGFWDWYQPASRDGLSPQC